MTHPARSIWWLHPACLFGAAGVTIAISAYAIPESTYRAYWRMPKFFDAQGLWLSLACCGVFALAAALSAGFARRLAGFGTTADLVEEIPWSVMQTLFRASFYLALLGYALWAGLAIQRGMTIQSAWDVIAGERGAMYDARFTYLQTVGGVTTLTQFGTAAAVLGAVIGICQGWAKVRGKLIALAVLALMRALLNSERFALIELIVPFTIAVLALKYFSPNPPSPRVRMLMNIAPVAGMLVLFLFFTGFEYFRSWTNYYAGRNLSLWEFGAMRLLGYYVTSFNNGAYFMNRLDPLNAPYFTLHFLWTFPLSGPAVKRLFPNPLLDSTDKWFYFPFLESESNVEFNNADGMLFPLMDFGIPGGLIYWFAAGLVCGLVFELYRRRQAAGVLFYPILYLGLLEVPLALYWGEGRAFLPLLLLISAPVMFAFTRRYKRALS